METIELKDMLRQAKDGIHFSCAYVSANKHEKKGGRWIEIPHAFLKVSKDEALQQTKQSIQPKSPSRTGHNDLHSIINLHLPNGEIRAAHIRLIRRFNGKTVI